MSAATAWDGRSPLVAKDYVPDNPNIAIVDWGTGYAELHGARHAREKLSHMFAAAPELLAACKLALGIFELSGLEHIGVQALRAAIAKAEGRE